MSCPWASWGSRGLPAGPQMGTGWGWVVALSLPEQDRPRGALCGGCGPPGWAQPTLCCGEAPARGGSSVSIALCPRGAHGDPHPSAHKRCHGDPVGTACPSRWGTEGTRGERSPRPAPRCSSAERHMKQLWAAPCDGLCPAPQPEPITCFWGWAGGPSAMPRPPCPFSRRRRRPEPRWLSGPGVGRPPGAVPELGRSAVPPVAGGESAAKRLLAR